ncbi:MAG: transporter substrate-binding domain-containing protein [Oscillospiraceae bacterium]|nr:transporter substrate-binding domain-containing protein [Oscillospiraceae bacterium]
MKKILFIVLAIMLVLAFSACSDSGEVTVESIKERGVLRVGVKDSLIGMGYLNPETGEYEGLEIDIARAIAEEMGVDIEFLVVTPTTRLQMIDSGDIDISLSNFTITEERKMSYHFTAPYYTDAVGVMVLKSSGIESLEDLDGKTVGVTMSSTSAQSLKDYLGEGYELSFDEFEDHAAIKLALSAGAIDAHCVDTVVLSTYMDDTTMILEDRFAAQPFGVVSKLSNTELNAYVDGLIDKWLSDGTIDAMREANGLLPSFEG